MNNRCCNGYENSDTMRDRCCDGNDENNRMYDHGWDGNDENNRMYDRSYNGNVESDTRHDHCCSGYDNSDRMNDQCCGLKGRKVRCEAVPCVENVEAMAVKNTCYRVAVFTGEYVQMTLMSIPVGQDVGVETHEDTDQLIRVEQGMGLVKMKSCERQGEVVQKVCQGNMIFVPAGTRHNVINIGRIPLKLSSVYAPPHHPSGIMQRIRPNEGVV